MLKTDLRSVHLQPTNADTSKILSLYIKKQYLQQTRGYKINTFFSGTEGSKRSNLITDRDGGYLRCRSAVLQITYSYVV